MRLRSLPLRVAGIVAAVMPACATAAAVALTTPAAQVPGVARGQLAAALTPVGGGDPGSVASPAEASTTQVTTDSPRIATAAVAGDPVAEAAAPSPGSALITVVTPPPSPATSGPSAAATATPAPTSRPAPAAAPTPRPTAPAHPSASPSPSPPPTPAPTPRPTPTPSPSPSPSGTPSDTNPPSSTPYSTQQIKDMIRAAASAHGVNGDCMVALAQRESGWNPNAYNSSGPYDGLFQFWPRTYRAHGGTDIWDPRQQSDVAATMMSQGYGQGAWGVSC